MTNSKTSKKLCSMTPNYYNRDHGSDLIMKILSIALYVIALNVESTLWMNIIRKHRLWRNKNLAENWFFLQNNAFCYDIVLKAKTAAARNRNSKLNWIRNEFDWLILVINKFFVKFSKNITKLMEKLSLKKTTTIQKISVYGR